MGIQNDIEKLVGQPILELVVKEFDSALGQNTPSMTGNLKSSLSIQKTGNNEYTLYGPAYARVVENGTPEPLSSTECLNSFS